MFIDIGNSIAHIKKRKLSAVKRELIDSLESLNDEIVSTRIELNKLLNNYSSEVRVSRKKALTRIIQIRNHIRKLLTDNFITELSTAQNRYITEQTQKPNWFGEFDQFVLDECESLSELRKLSTGLVWHIDHMIPLKGKKVSGLHCGLNFQVIPAYINLSKGSKNIMQEAFEWLHYL